jgi:hypothetical protein
MTRLSQVDWLPAFGGRGRITIHEKFLFYFKEELAFRRLDYGTKNRFV